MATAAKYRVMPDRMRSAALMNLFQEHLVRNDPVRDPVRATTVPDMVRNGPSGS